MDAVDTHTHLDDPAFEAELDAVIARGRSAGVARMVVVGADPARWARVEAVSRRTGGLLFLGVHPWWSAGVDVDAAAADLSARPLTGVGELGLDAARGEVSAQLPVFRAQLAVARARGLPVSLHCVRAWGPLLATLKADGCPAGVVHGWGGAPELLAPVLSLGLSVGIGPAVLKTHARKVRESAAKVPVDRLLLETDCPPGEPADLRAVAAEVAALRGASPETIWRITAANANRLFPERAP